MTTRIAIVGAGLGGLTAANALLSRGFDVTLYEQSSELKEVGAGVQLSPNAMKVLMALGLDKAALANAFEPERHVVRNWKSGAVVSATQLKGFCEKQFGAGYYGFHRHDLHAALLAQLPPERIVLNATCVDVETNDTRALLRFADGREVSADAVIGADGIHSVVREKLFGPESPRFTDHICWRGVVPTASLPKGLIEPDMTAWFGPHSTFVTYYMRGGSLVNWAGFCEAGDWRLESWRVEGDRNEALKTYKDWNPAIAQLIENTEKLYQWALYDREPQKQWTRGRITLLGDAAHPMLPYLAQGACMALEDAYALSSHLAQNQTSIQDALKAYEALRLPRTAQVQRNSSARARTNELTSPVARLQRDLAYKFNKLIHPERHTYGIEWIYGYDITTIA
ncbi:MAG: FAD-dependent monooxygenase [Burkholderiales bacterium]